MTKQMTKSKMPRSVLGNLLTFCDHAVWVCPLTLLFLQDSPSSKALKEDRQQNMQLPREVIQQLRDVVFGFDTFYVTGVENYQANGVLFKGNLRGRSAAESYSRTSSRLKVLLLPMLCKAQAP